ncbi:hypothetical protein [Photobacterium leiognathi]|uniref:hypothetical protein n=1 Tax=Photobacterium leiognathi TaxID=553611 RepID=UPI0029820E1E|nr:hypothetical protein [Photobacterium leiognathi]
MMKLQSEYRAMPRIIYTATTVRCPRCLHNNLLVKKDARSRYVEYFIKCPQCDKNKNGLNIRSVIKH